MDSVYQISLIIHSLNRWFVLGSLILFMGCYKFNPRKTEQIGVSLTNFILIGINLQLILGVLLFYQSPISNFFWSDLPETMKPREIRFFGLEHTTVMLVAIGIIDYAIIRWKKSNQDSKSLKKLFQWVVIGTLLILSSIPWSFSPLISRPLFRF